MLRQGSSMDADPKPHYAGIGLQDRGHHELKGIEGTWHLFAAG
jgi:hypothetical protein